MAKNEYLDTLRKAKPVIKTIGNKVEYIAYLFDDIDNTAIQACTELIEKLAELTKYLDEIGAEQRDQARADLMAERQCPHCGLAIKGPVYFRHVQNCTQTDMAAAWGERRAKTRAGKK